MRRTIHPAKRIFDITLTVFALPAVLAFAALAFVCLFIEHVLRRRPFDPLLYHETRISAGEPFTLYKFFIFRGEVIEGMRSRGEYIRTKELEHNGSLTFVGWCLKQIYMDELPQLWSVVRGDMSIVGPRPVNSETYERFLREGITVKSQIKAGITGPYQSLKDDRTASAHTLDQQYIDFVTTQPWYEILRNDMRIMTRTARTVLKARGI